MTNGNRSQSFIKELIMDNNLTRALELIKEAEHYLSQNMNDLAHVDILEAMYLLNINTKEMDQQ
jgi:hypothetical protein